MKQRFSKIFGTALLAGAAVFITPSVQAIGINGEIGLIGNFIPRNASNVVVSDLLQATKLTDFAVIVGAGTGDYSGAYTGLITPTAVTHSDLVLSPFASVEPLWTISGGYSFDLLTLQIGAGSTSTELNLTGTGIAYITGLDPTPGKWNLTANTEGSAFTFSSGVAAQASVPDGGTTLALFGLALIGLFGFRQMAQKQA